MQNNVVAQQLDLFKSDKLQIPSELRAEIENLLYFRIPENRQMLVGQGASDAARAWFSSAVASSHYLYSMITLTGGYEQLYVHVVAFGSLPTGHGS